MREQLKIDCVRLGDFAVKSVETMKAGDEKGVVRLYTGTSQANVLMLLTELVDHLAECASSEDFPGDCAEVRRLLPERPDNSHKGANGRALLLVGSESYTGAALLSSAAALRAGCGILTAAVPDTRNLAMV